MQKKQKRGALISFYFYLCRIHTHLQRAALLACWLTVLLRVLASCGVRPRACVHCPARVFFRADAGGRPSHQVAPPSARPRRGRPGVRQGRRHRPRRRPMPAPLPDTHTHSLSQTNKQTNAIHTHTYTHTHNIYTYIIYMYIIYRYMYMYIMCVIYMYIYNTYIYIHII